MDDKQKPIPIKIHNIPTDPSPSDWPDGLPPCLVYVDQQGVFWHQGAEMIRAGINRLLTDHVHLDDKGRYVIKYNGQRCFVDVEDTLFVITRFDHEPAAVDAEEYNITLNDGQREKLDPETLRMGPENIIYASVKSGRFPARFLRKSYYQLAEHLVEEDGLFALPYQGKAIPIKDQDQNPPQE